MITFLTSHIGGSRKKEGKRIPTPLCPDNNFIQNLQKRWKKDANILIMSADPEARKTNHSIRNIWAESFPMSGLSFRQIMICDQRNESAVNHISEYDVLLLAGGHVPTQNAFFKKIQLKEHLKSFDGILIGISAGTMNSAKTVYAQPELEGESTDGAIEQLCGKNQHILISSPSLKE